MSENKKLEPGFIRDSRLIEELTKSSDRGKVIVGAAAIDELLGRLLKKHFVQNSKILDTTFDGAAGFLGTFSAKIKMSYLLGLISEELFKDLETLRKIRNKFAHDIFDCNLSNQTIKNWCNDFIFVKEAFENVLHEHPHDGMFILEIATLQVALIKKITRIESKSVKEFEINDLGFEDIDFKYLDGK